MTHLPTGTITFLFTDIEGSGKLWERHADAMRPALARHDALVRKAIEDRGGAVFKTIGDAFCAAFSTAPDALAAAIDVQLALQREPWADDAAILVRVGLHTGDAEERGDDYYGPALSRVARLLSVAHGGQTLVSAASYELVRDCLPEGVGLRDLGAHRLKNPARSEQAFQVTHPQLPASFPPLRSLDHTPNNLPLQLTSFIGREKEMAEVRTRLQTTRLLTLTGAGGSGKTRLSLEYAAVALDDYPDGVWLVELAPLTDPALIPQAVAGALGVTEQTGQSLLQSLIEYLKPKRLLILLDNCEHLGLACAQIASALLRACPNLRILATSREPLNIAGEQVSRVPSLSLPDPKNARAATASSLAPFEAVRLFIERAVLVKPDFAVTNANAPHLAELCHRLDGIPLALELAAARARSLSVEDIASRLHDRFRLLANGDRSALPRQQTLRALVDWSYDLLSEPEKTIFARLSVFAGGWTLEAAEAVCGFAPLEDGETRDLLTDLADKSLVVVEEDAGDGGATRYRLLETLRQYAEEKRDQAAEGAETRLVRERHRNWFLALVEKAEPLLAGPEQAVWLARLETEHDNLRAALALGAGDDDNAVEACLRLSGSLLRFWVIRGYLTEGREHLEKALERADRLPSPGTVAVAKALQGTGVIASVQGDFVSARAWYEESLAIYRAQNDKRGVASVLYSLGGITHDQGDDATARTLYEESLAVFRDLKNDHGVAHVLYALAIILNDQSQWTAARSLFEESLALSRKLANQQGIANALSGLGNVAYDQEDYEAARGFYNESLISHRTLGYKRGVALALNNQGDVAMAQGDAPAARALYEESLILFRELGDKRGSAFALEGVARLFLSEADPRRATVLWGATNAVRTAVGVSVPPNQQARQTAQLERARAVLGDDAFQSAWTEGQALTWEQAVADALNPA